jgi:nucleoside 2-deoxyribosyltransferase
VKIYLAGGMRTEWRQYIKTNMNDLEVTWLDPTESGLTKPKEYTFYDMACVESCDLILCYLEKTNPSGIGLAFEMGYAKGLKKKILFVNEQLDNKYTSILMECGCLIVESLDRAIEIISKMLRIFEK